MSVPLMSRPTTARGSAPTRRTSRAGPLFALPALAMVALFFVFPLALTVWVSLHDWPLLGEATFAGLRNYGEVPGDQEFRESIWFTTQYTVIVTAATFLVGLGLALLVRERVRGVGIFRTAFFMPVVTGLAASTFLWSWLYNEQVGAFSGFLRWLGVADGPVQFLGTTNGVLWSMVVMMIWKSSGFLMLILLVGMQAIPDEIYESARIDGAGAVAMLRRVTLPLLRHSIALALLLTVTTSCLTFEQFFITSRGGPNNTTITAVHWLYTQAFTRFRLGYASALAMALLVVIVLINVVQMLMLRRNTE